MDKSASELAHEHERAQFKAWKDAGGVRRPIVRKRPAGVLGLVPRAKAPRRTPFTTEHSQSVIRRKTAKRPAGQESDVGPEARLSHSIAASSSGIQSSVASGSASR